MKRSVPWGLVAVLVSAMAGAQGQGSAEAGSNSDADWEEVRSTDKAARFSAMPYSQRYRPEPNLWEIGLFGGVFAPAFDHNLGSTGPARQPYHATGLSLGARLAYFPLSFVGVEVEGMANPTTTRTTGDLAMLYSLRGHGILQLPLTSIVPFALVGAGVLATSSGPMGHDVDPLFHFGVGVKLPLSHILSVRADLRDNLTQANGQPNGAATHNVEVLLGATFTLDRTPPPWIDSDYDGVPDSRDACKDRGALTVDGCHAPIVRSEFDDVSTQCAPLPEAVARPVEPAVIAARTDADADGELPEAVKKFSGVVTGISFTVGKDTITKESYPTLDAAYAVLVEHPSIRLEVSGHSSSEGKPLANEKLSQQRANAVRAYLVKKGIAPERVAARGAGADEPIADNATQAGREQNRRIEFRVLSAP